MSSLRPLITITLLAAVGVFLYMKINETEPTLPPGLESWTTGGFEIGGAADATASSPMTTAPKYDAGSAPPFTAGAPTVSAGVKATADAAPPWSPGPLVVGDAPKIEASLGASAESSPLARSADPPAATLPEMPSLPGEVASSDLRTAATTPPSPTETKPTTDPAAPAAAPVTNPADPATDALAADPITPTDPAATPPAPSSMYASVRVAVQGALDRGELAQALLLLSDWYGDPSLTPDESKEVEALLGQLAGSVIYEGPPAHRLEQPYVVQAGETLEDIADKYNVPAALLAKINGVADPGALEPGRELKVLRGPFSALVDISERKMTLMLDRRYAGKFAVDLDPATTIEEGQWKVDQKLVSPAGGGVYGQADAGGEDRSLLLANLASPNTPAAIVRGPGSADPIAAAPSGRVLRLKSADVNDVYDILSVGSRVTVRR